MEIVAPELAPPADLTSSYIDPDNGTAYVFRSTPPGGLYEILYQAPPEESVKKQLSRFLWLNLCWSTWPGRDWVVEQAKTALPIIDTLIDRIDIEAKVSSETNKPEFRFTITAYESFREVVDETETLRESTPFIYSLIQMVSELDSFHIALGVVFEVADDEVIDTLKGIDTRKKGRAFKPKEDVDPNATNVYGTIKMGIHTAKQFFGFSESYAPEIALDWRNKYGQVINPAIDRYGASLTDTQHRVLEGIMSEFTKSNYKGNLPAIPKDDLLIDFDRVSSVDKLPRVFDNVDEIPCLKLGRRHLVRLAGLNDESQADVSRVTDAMNYLASTTFCFYYNRVAMDGKNKPIKEKSGDWKKETVVLFDTLLKVKIVLDESATQFQYYEISPSPIFLDQHSTYFLLIPQNWREEVKAQIGAKKASSYTYKFLLYLRLQFEMKRRHNSAPGNKRKVKYEIVQSWRSIAREIRIPESVWRDKKSRALAIIEDAYSAAKQLGYLTHYSRSADESKDTLVLNPAKYPDPKQDPIEIPAS